MTSVGVFRDHMLLVRPSAKIGVGSEGLPQADAALNLATKLTVQFWRAAHISTLLWQGLAGKDFRGFVTPRERWSACVIQLQQMPPIFNPIVADSSPPVARQEQVIVLTDDVFLPEDRRHTPATVNVVHAMLSSLPPERHGLTITIG